MDARRRLETLQQELRKGEELLADLDMRRTQTRDKMLRISGAIQILTEMLNDRAEPLPMHANAGD